MVDGPNTCFPPRAPPEAGLAADQIMGAANPVRSGVLGYRNSGPLGKVQLENMVFYILAKLPKSIFLHCGMADSVGAPSIRSKF